MSHDLSPNSAPSDASSDAQARMHAIDRQVAHVWMVRCFLKHCDEASDDPELQQIHRDLYDFMLALGPALADEDAPAYLKAAKKKFNRLRRATELFVEIQAEVSTHTNFKMAAASLQFAVQQIQQQLS